MKRLLLLLAAVGCANLISCSENLFDDLGKIPVQLEELQKRFDFSEVDTEGLEISDYFNESKNGIAPHYFGFPKMTIIEGHVNGRLWIGVFENSTGRLKYQYTDYDQPVLYESGKSEMHGIYFEDDLVKGIAIRYPKSHPNTFHLDLIIVKSDDISRYTIDENALCAPLRVSNNLARWTDGILCMYYVENLVVFDLSDMCFKCHISQYDTASASFDSSSIFWARADSTSGPHLFIAPNDPFHCFYMNIAAAAGIIREYKLTFDVGFLAEEKTINIFNDFDPRDYYSLEYKIKTDDYVSAVVTQRKYYGTVTTKTVDVRLENDELKVEIQ